MKPNVTLVLYCAESAEFASLSIPKPSILQERMFIAFSNLMMRVEKIVWAPHLVETIICCGMIVKVREGVLEGTRLVFPFGKIPQSFWTPEKFNGWKVSTADSQWDSILSPLIIIDVVDGDRDNFTGED